MSARYYVQGDELWMISAPGAAGGGDSPVCFRRWDYSSDVRDRNNQFWDDLIESMRANGMCEQEDRVAQ